MSPRRPAAGRDLALQDGLKVKELIDKLGSTGETSPGLAAKCMMLANLRGESTRIAELLDRMLVERIEGFTASVARAREIHEQFESVLEKISASPWHAGRLIRTIETDAGLRAVVLLGGSYQAIDFGPEVDPTIFAKGDTVFVGGERNLVMSKLEGVGVEGGETGFFEGVASNGRLVLRWRDETVVVDAAASLDVEALRPGQQLRWDRASYIALEALERSQGRRYLFDGVPDIGTESVGGQTSNLRRLLAALTARLVNSRLASRYGVSSQRSILLHGPSGTGKTLMARVAAAAVQRATGRRCSFGVVKPGEWESCWVGEAQRNIRECFEALKEEAASGRVVVLLLDEIDAIGRIRGRGMGSDHSDRFLAALLAELDGFSDRGDVAVICTTNRKDLLDPALVDRLCDVDIAVGRPDARAAREIFDVHLAEELPYGGSDGGSTRRAMIDAAVTGLYAPNCQNEVCRLRFRDGSERTVCAGELVSGRLIEQLSRSVKERGFQRHLGGDDGGLAVRDMDEAVAEAVEAMRETLTITNVHAHLVDLPLDADVVGVEPVIVKVQREHRYLKAV
ncbi:MAG: AAA family ATPase [Candidatus Binatia bacterium]